MKSPFAIFRDNQKVLMVVLVGLSMIGFVFLGAINDPTNIPTALIFITIIAVAGGAAWILGMPQKRSAEYGIWGVVFGVAIAILVTRTGGPAQAMTAQGGDVSVEELVSLRQKRDLANQFVAHVLQATQADNPDDMFPQQTMMQKQRQYMLGFNLPPDRDVLTTELLYREAEEMGLEANEATVTEYLNQISDGKLSQEKLKEICGELKISVSQLYEILERELQARMAAELLYDYAFDEIYRISPTLPPEQYWDFYRKLYVRQKVAAAAIPVENFIDEDAEPPESELQELFAAHAANFPNRTAEGLPAPGDPGFRQPRRVRIGFLEAVFEEAKETIEPVTEEEVRERYQAEYVRPAEEAAQRAAEEAEEEAAAEEAADGPELPGDDRPADEEPAGEEPADNESEGDASAPETESSPESEAEPEAAEPETSENDTSSLPIPSGSATQLTSLETESPAIEQSGEEPPADPGPAKQDDVTETETDEPADPAADAEAAENENDSEPESESDPEPAAEGDDAQSDDAAGTPEATDPAVPSSDVPLLDELLKEEIRIKIENERTREKLREKMAEAARWIESNIGEAIFAPEESEEHMSDERAAELIRDYAQEHNLHYGETELLSFTELMESEEYPVGQAMTVVPAGARPETVPNAVFNTGKEDRYRPVTAEEPVFSSWFVFWKLEDKDDYVPESMNDERVREQVVEAWRELQARPRAQARAEELAELVRNGDAPMDEVFGEITITGEEDSLLLQVTETGDFTWLTTGSLEPQLYSRTPPRLMSPAGIELGGEDFMQVVFDELAPGEVGVAPNADRSIYYIVSPKDRIPAAGEEFETFRQNFLKQQVFEKNDMFAGMGFDSIYRQLAVMKTQETRSDYWVDDLWERHGAEQFVGG